MQGKGSRDRTVNRDAFRRNLERIIKNEQRKRQLQEKAAEDFLKGLKR